MLELSRIQIIERTLPAFGPMAGSQYGNEVPFFTPAVTQGSSNRKTSDVVGN